MTRNTVPVERRAAERKACAHIAEIRLGSSVAVRALVKDVSLNGARLQIPENAWLPACFDLTVPGLGLRRRATCRWRGRDFAGLEFDTIET